MLLYGAVVSAQDSVSLHEYVVTGSVTELKREKALAPVQIFTREYFQQNNITNLYEAVAMVNGIIANIDGAADGSGDIEINGMDGVYSLVMIDGTPVSGGNDGLYAMNGIPIAIIERIEIIKGPNSTLYGSNAMAGVVNVITLHPEHSPRVFADVRATTIGEVNAEAGMRLRAGAVNGIVAATVYHSGVRIDHDRDGFLDVPMVDRVSLFNKWSFRNRDQRPSYIYARYLYESRAGGQVGWTTADIGSSTVYGEYALTNRAEVGADFALPIRNQDIHLKTAYTYHAQNSYYGAFPFNNKEHNARMQLSYSKQLATAFQFSGGVGYHFYHYSDNLSSLADTPNELKRPEAFVNHAPFFFGQGTIAIGTAHEIGIGLRYGYLSQYHSHLLIPQLVYRWASADRDFVRIGVGGGYRTPNVFADDRYAFTNGKRIILSGQIAPELNYGGWVSYEKKICRRDTFLIETRVFTNYVIHKIEANTDSLPDAVTYSNQNSQGINFGLSLSADMSFHIPLHVLMATTVLGNYTVDHNGGVTTYSTVLNSPTWSTNVAISYAFRRVGISTQLTGYVLSPMLLHTVPHDYRPDHSPWYSMINLQVTKQFKFGLDIYAGVNNLLNLRPSHVILRPEDPFNKQVNDPIANPHGYRYDSSYIYAMNQGIKAFVGVRYMLR